MLYVGLTGNIASGKSEVAIRLAALGATVVDADELARRAVAPGTPAYQKVVARWGRDILLPDGSLDRGALRHTVFADREQLEELNDMLHPVITRLRKELVADSRARGDAVLVYVVPLLFERQLAPEFDRIILVDSPTDLRFERLVAKRGISAVDAGNMISSQMPAELKRARADFVIENNGSLNELNDQIDSVWARLTATDARSSLAG